MTLYDFSEMFETEDVAVEKGSAERKTRIKSHALRLLKLFKRRPSTRTAIKIAILIAAATSALFPLPAPWIERFYSNGFYLWLQSWLTPFANLLPFALIDALLIALVLGLPIWWAFRIRRAGRGRRRRAVAALTLNTLVLAGAIFLSFQLLWGFNYMREPLTYKLEYDQQRITPQAELAMLRQTVEQLNRETADAHSDAHSDSWSDDRELRQILEPPFDATLAMMETAERWRPPSQKRHCSTDTWERPALMDSRTRSGTKSCSTLICWRLKNLSRLLTSGLTWPATPTSLKQTS